MRLWLLTWLVVLGFIAGCRPGSPPGESDAAATPLGTVMAAVEPAPNASAEERAAAQARNLFAQQRGIAAQAVVVTSVEEVTWSDSSLGCPDASQQYAAVMTPGYRITVSGGGEEAVFHSDLGSANEQPRVVSCADAAEPGSPSFGGPALDKAMADIAERAPGAVFKLESSLVAPVASLVCDGTAPAANAEGPRKVILEFHIRADETVHVYRAWADEILYCGTSDSLNIR